MKVDRDSEDYMRRACPATFAGAIVIGLTAMNAMALAQSVPVPKPAPQSRPVPPAAVEPPRPSAPLALGAPLPNPAIPLTRPRDAVASLGGTIAFDAKQRAMIDRVNTYLTGVRTLVGDFVQVAPNGARSEGKFYLQKPGNLRFEYDPPATIDLIADGVDVVVRDRRLATQDLYPLQQTPLRFLLADRIELLKDTNVVGAYADDMFVTLVIEERQVFGGTHRLMLMFGAQDYQLRQWTVTDPQGLDTTVAVYNLDKTKKPEPGLFKIDRERVLQ
jgi:outer membrane lipoprotein-sorting protein